MRKLYFQGDMLVELVKAAIPATAAQVVNDPDGSTVIGRGEVTGHRHRFALEDRVAMFRDDSLARDIPADLYVGHVKVAEAGATLLHEEHDAIPIPAGTYRIRRQREWTTEQARVVAD